MKKRLNIILLLFTVLGAFTGYNLYIMYKNIEIKEADYEVQRTASSTNYKNDVENNILSVKSTEDMLEGIIESVVGISRLTNAGGSILNNVTSEDLGLGTGLIVSENGYILSNSHVTGEKYSICYVTIDEHTYKGTVVFSEPDLDLSIIKVNAQNLKYATLGDSTNLRVGGQVYAIGNPIGYEFKRTVTSGIISALNRTIKIEENENVSYISDLIQTDATINPGNSGGPLVNKYGEVIGINTVKITSAEGIGFAIPINVIKPIIEKIKKGENIEQATLNIYAYDSEVAEYLNLKNKIVRGIYVSEIITNGAASKSDLKSGDVITHINDVKINTINDLREFIYSKVPGDEVVLKIVRDERELETKVTLGMK